MRSKDSYDNPEGAKIYLEYLETESGQVHQSVLYSAFRGTLGEDKDQKILDAASGPGWLAAKLRHEFPNVQCCDGSKFFIDYIQTNYHGLTARQVDLAEPLPYQDQEFDTIIFSMAAHDVEDQKKTFAEMNRILKPGGKLLISLANPYYAYPVGVWKRGIIGRLLFQKPKLKVRPYHWFGGQSRNYTFKKSLESYFYKLSEHLNNIIGSGFNLQRYEDLESLEDSPRFTGKYKLHRYPYLIFLEFKKVAQ
jgi:ubiquinone/menaquinone biosynthesis C-methylase UbiE